MDRRPTEVLAAEAAEAAEDDPRPGGRRPAELTASTASTELEREQAYVSMLYGRLDRLRAHARAQLQTAQWQDSGGTYQARLDRDAFVSRHAERLAQLEAVEHGLCFGRLDRRDGSRMYVGRLGLSDDDNEPLLVDWRAPAAQPFYRATAAAPGDVVRRRHLRTRGRAIMAIDDDVLNLDALSDAERGTLNGEAALLASLAAGRTGRMADIVATIQAEQDRIIRAGLRGILVVQGGPGTGKTAVALHRAAYLLYTHRERLAGRGVLVVGPNPTFLRYIEQVLPSLGETDVLLSTVDRLYPGVAAAGQEPPAAATLKGGAGMARVLAAAVRDRQLVPDDGLEVAADGQVLRLDRASLERVRQRARAAGVPHNQARPVFERELLTALAEQVVARLVGDLPEVDLPDDDDLLADDVPNERLLEGELDDLRAELAAAPEVRAAMDRLWPVLTPRQLLIDLFSAAVRLAAAAPHLDPAERALLERPAPDGPDGATWWTPTDVPLLDEAAELLGEDSRAVERAAARRAEQGRRELAYAREVLAEASIGDAARYAPDTDQLDPAVVAARYRRQEPADTVAERASQDRTWTFGHIIVDEAQELSAMAWRMLARRCPQRSMTVVGDVAQTGALWGASSWAQVLEPNAAGRWRTEELTVNYRTPAEIMALAADVLATAAPDLAPPRSVRHGGTPPWTLRLEPERWPARLPEVVAAEAAAVAGGRLAVLVPAARLDGIGRLLTGALPQAAARGPDALDAPVAVLAVADAKGLEFDGVVVVDPAAILGASPHGANDLYMALTRATKRLGIVHPGELPAVLGRAT